jgi:hypothetical protein
MVEGEANVNISRLPRHPKAHPYPQEFQTIRDRDSWAIIRGYVYQVELTIESWLAIGDNEVIELERGEDIDLVANAIKANDDESRNRLLNQVKCRKASLTLGSQEALMAIACFIEHRAANPQLNLRFRFTTNAQVACERPALFEKSTPALSVWKSLQFGELTGDQATKARQSLKQFLRSKKKPEKFNEDTWMRFQSFLDSATDKDLKEIICRFAWVTSQAEPASIALGIKSKLIDEGYAATTEEADNIYQRLFYYIFKLLCSPGKKELVMTPIFRTT